MKYLIAAFLASLAAVTGWQAVVPQTAAHAQSSTVNVSVTFPGLSSVHVYVQQPDGVKDAATGKVIESSTWNSDSASIDVAPGTYDVRVVQGPTTKVFDNVDCASSCKLDVPLAQLNASLPGLQSVHVYAHVSDGIPGSYGDQVASATWQSQSASLLMFRGTYDVRIVQGPATVVLDNIDCTGATCAVTAPTKTLTASFPGLANVHVYVQMTDGAAGTYGEQVLASTWNTDSASLKLLQGVYDVRVVNGPAQVVLDTIDCTASGACSVSVPLATLNVSFPGLSSAHVYAHMTDGQPGTYGTQVSSSTWQTDATSIVLLQGVYDVRVVDGPAATVIDNVDCTSTGKCSVDVPLTTLTVNFPGLSSAHIYAHLSDGAAGTYGQQVLANTWKSDSTSMILLRGVYDVRAVYGPSAVVMDDVDCTGATCTVNVPLATLDVSFPGLTSAHMYIHTDDGAKGTYGQQVAAATWKTDAASFVLLAGKYDLRAVYGPTTVVVDSIDCTSGECAAKVPLTTLTATFTGKSNVHTYVQVDDNAPATFGQLVASSTYKTDKTSFVLLPGFYDVRFVNGGETVVVDGVDCTGAACTASYDQAVAVVPTATPVATNTPVPTATPTAPPSSARTAAQSGAATITFLTAACSPESAIAVAVTGGQDPNSANNGTSEAVPSDITAYGCELVTSAYRLYLLGSSTGGGTFIDAGLSTPATLNANDNAYDGSAATIGAGESFYAAPGVSAIRRFSIAEFDHPGSAWVGLPYLDLQCWSDGVNNDNADGAGWNGAAYSAGQQVYCILYFLNDEPEPTATPTPSPAPGETPTAVPTIDGDLGTVIKELHPDVKVDEEHGLVTWIIRPSGLKAHFYVWDANADSCQGLGGALCGGIAGDGSPGAFDPVNEDYQHLIVTQNFKVSEGQCEPVVNTVEWSTDPNAAPEDRQSMRVEYRCSGATALGWPLLAGAFFMAAAVAWYIVRRIPWQS